MDREDAIALSQDMAKIYPQSYTTDGFIPHEWVIAAIKEAYEFGYADAKGENN